MLKFSKRIARLFRVSAREHEPDSWLLFIIAVIIIFGFVMLSSASSAISFLKFGNSFYYFNHQLFGLILGIIAFWFFSRIDYHLWQRYAFWFLVFSIILLLLVFIPGLSATYGKARSWINIFGFSLQPSEFVKISFLLYLAAWLERRVKQLGDISRGTGPFLVVLGIVGLLMILQPDVGTLSIIALTSLIVYFVGGGSIKHILVIMALGAAGLVFLINIYPYQMNRIRCMIDPHFSAEDICYQVNQSLIAVGSGGLWGRGLGESRQKFMYIPEVSSDSIFAIIAEELGFVFSATLVLLYLLLFFRGYLVAKRAPDGYGRILAIGIVSWIVLQAAINIGGITNLIPMTGVPLPLISYGGSAMLASLSALGILVNISKYTKVNSR
ncbi:putative lipid II flippase FtsW [Candidatus Parcubacteria bacterium]|nr:MAG: putative lipid II flippase FtsW [Candidatus Parcubacteria bacterium]